MAIEERRGGVFAEMGILKQPQIRVLIWLTLVCSGTVPTAAVDDNVDDTSTQVHTSVTKYTNGVVFRHLHRMRNITFNARVEGSNQSCKQLVNHPHPTVNKG